MRTGEKKGKMKRNKNVEIIRAISILLVMLYHFWVLSGKELSFVPVRTVISMGGELGVTMFFVLSGFGIYTLLDSETSRDIPYGKFIFSRWRKLAPQYYACLFVLLVLTEQAVFLAPEHSMVLISHVFFFHSFSPSWAGMINGALWTMGVMMQFYILAYFIYKLQKHNLLFSAVICLLSVGIKFALYHYMLPSSGNTEPVLYFVYGRQIYSALDNFVIGMISAQLAKRKTPPLHVLAIILILAGTTLYLWSSAGLKRGIYTDTVMAYMWHFICAGICGAIIYAACLLPLLSHPSPVVKFLHWVAKYSYGIYLWHLPIANAVLNHSAWIKNLPYILVIVILTTFSLAAGFMSAAANKWTLPGGKYRTFIKTELFKKA